MRTAWLCPHTAGFQREFLVSFPGTLAIASQEAGDLPISPNQNAAIEPTRPADHTSRYRGHSLKTGPYRPLIFAIGLLDVLQRALRQMRTRTSLVLVDVGRDDGG